ncbi:hypothetical protein FW774_05935 [Pedobacter sp. BS3]|uniref:hypothetical protein n=1 Tax=Pedobacter sp. BS3 TaxID=2567937 RepID=UPI0011F06101|nr:hypothetical protein [Pedobacter sp. BS3]TZF84527.1 hypothetical protein FW774_05935 [Pedobacter sp. BS3]
MAEVKQTIIDYLTEELTINSAALKNYDNGDDPIKQRDTNPEIQKMREIEAIKLRDRIHELTRHIAVIKRMIV